MAIDSWPFYPDRLTDIMGPTPKQREVARDLFRFIEAASAIRLKRSVAIIDRGLERFDPEIEGFEYEAFCHYFRLDKSEKGKKACPGGDERCREWDRRIAAKILKMAYDNKLQGDWAAFPCHLNVVDMCAVIRVVSAPIAALFAGQFLPLKDTQQKARQEVLDGIEQLDKPQYDDPLLENLPLVELSPEAKSKLISLTDKLKPASEGFEKTLKTQAKIIGDIAQEFWERYKAAQEQSFINSLRERGAVLAPEPTHAWVAEELSKQLGSVCAFCGVEWMAFFADWAGEGNILDLVAFHGIDFTDQDQRPHFNWNKCKAKYKNLPDERPKRSDLRRIIERGLRWRRGMDKDIHREFEECSLVVPQERGTKPERTVIVFGAMKRDFQYGREVAFLRQTCDILADDFRHRNRLLRLSHGEKQWEEIVDFLTHQVRSVLDTIKSTSDYMAKKSRAAGNVIDEDYLYAATILQTHVQHLAAHSKLTLAAARDAVDLMLKYVPEDFNETDLATLVRQYGKHYEGAAARRNIAIRFGDGLVSPKKAEIVPGAFETVLMNVLHNAVKYGREGTYIKLDIEIDESLAYYAENLKIVVRDVGCGIPADEQSKVFGKGFQGTRRSDEAGEGLGLYEAREIIAAHGGSIWCNSYPRSSGSGLDDWLTVFIITTPTRQTRRT
ncbi:MAG TPA: hypothetical protein HPP83_10865 [Candidatus Hydrogenedentes bacterium]|nr:hypothetical protein [Candidatus Hydrogenedentota bacterium]